MFEPRHIESFIRHWRILTRTGSDLYAALVDDVRFAFREADLLSDATILLGLMLIAGTSIRLAEFAPAKDRRNFAADEIAGKFAAPDASGQFDERFDFAPRLRFLGLQLTHDRERSGATADNQPANDESGVANDSAARMRADAQTGTFDALGLVVVRDLPADSTFSAGVRVSPTEWALAQADLKDLTLTLPGTAGTDVKAGIEVFDASGVAAGGMELQIKRLPQIDVLTDNSDDDARNTAARPARHRNIATGAIVRKRTAGKRSAAVHRSHKVHVKLRRLPRRPIASKVSVVPKPQVASKAKTTAAQPLDPKTASQPLYAPAAETSSPLIVNGAGQGILKNLGVFPRSPMEEEAMRR